MTDAKRSKSAKKREYLALQALGEALIGLSAEQLASIDMDERLLDAVLAAKQMKAHSALRRQKQLLGKLMRDANPEPIRTALAQFGLNDRRTKAVFRDTEHWRDRIAAEGSVAVAAFFEFVGKENPDVSHHASAYAAASFDKARKLALRGLFTAIHKELTFKLQSPPQSL